MGCQEETEQRSSVVSCPIVQVGEVPAEEPSEVLEEVLSRTVSLASILQGQLPSDCLHRLKMVRSNL